MGFVFLERLEVKHYYICGVCGVELVDLTAPANLSLAPGCLYSKVVNVFLDTEKDEQLVTGRYTVAFVFCCNCCRLLGVRYVRVHDILYSYTNGLYGLHPNRLTRIHSGSSFG